MGAASPTLTSRCLCRSLADLGCPPRPMAASYLRVVLGYFIAPPPSPLQPENIMLQEKDVPKPQIKIIDFGLAQKLEDGVIFKSLCGTPQYIGMELLAGLGGQWDPWRPSCKGADESWDSFTGRGTCVMGTYWGTRVVVPPDIPPPLCLHP